MVDFFNTFYALTVSHIRFAYADLALLGTKVPVLVLYNAF